MRKSWGLIFSVPGRKGGKRGGKEKERGGKGKRPPHTVFQLFLLNFSPAFDVSFSNSNQTHRHPFVIITRK